MLNAKSSDAEDCWGVAKHTEEETPFDMRYLSLRLLRDGEGLRSFA